MDLTLVKPLTWMNDSGLAVRKVLAREHAPLVDLLVVTDDFALPFGKLRFREGGGPGGHNGLRSIIDELGTEKFSRLRVGIGAPERGFKDHVLNGFEPDERQRLDELLDAGGRRGRGMGPPRDVEGGEPLQHVRAPAGRRGAARRAGRGRRAARRDGDPPDARPAGGGCCRGGTTRDRLDRVRHARASAAATGGSPRPRRGRRGVRAGPRPAPAACPTSARCRRCSARPGRSPRSANGSAAPAPPRRADVDPARREVVPRRGARDRRRRRAARLDRPRRRDRRPRRRGAPGVARRRRRGRGARAADGARLRAERARRRRDRGPRRGAVGVAGRPGPDPRRERPGARPAHDRPRRPAGRRRAILEVGGRLRQDALLARPARPRLRAGARGRRSRRVRPSRRDRRRLPAVGAAAGPDRVLRRRDRLAPGLRPDGPADRRAARGGRAAARVGVPRSPTAAWPRSATRSGRARRRSSPSGSPRTSSGSRRRAGVDGR